MLSRFVLAVVLTPATTGFLVCNKATPTSLSLQHFLERSLQQVAFQGMLVRELGEHEQYLSKVERNDVVLEVGSDYEVALGGHGSDPAEPQMNVKLSRLFWGTGTSAFAEARGSLQDPNASRRFSVGIAQDIVRNAFGRSERLRVRSADLQKQLALHEIAEAYEDALSSLMTLYVDWSDAKADLDLAESTEQNHKKLLSNTERRFAAGVADSLALNKMKMAFLSRRETTLEKRHQYEAFSNEVAAAMESAGDYLPMAASIDRAQPNLDQSMQRFFKEGRTIKILSLVKEEARQEVLVRREALLPSLRLQLQLDLLEQPNASLIGSPMNLKVGGSFLWRLWNKEEQARYEWSRLEARREALGERQRRAELKAQLRTLKNRIERHRERLLIGGEREAIAEQVALETRRRYGQGRSSLASVLDEERSLENLRYQNLYRQFAIDKLLIEWRRLTDSLVVRRQGKIHRKEAE